MKWLFGFLIPLFFIGCSTSRARENWSFPFEYKIPQGEALESSAISRSFPGSFSEVWETTLVVLSQSAIIADIKRDAGLITYFNDLSKPYVVVVKAGTGGETNVLFDTGEFEVSLINKPGIARSDRATEAEKFFARVATQLLAEKRWKLLTQPGQSQKTASTAP